MARYVRNPKGIFVLEGDWTGNLKSATSVEPIFSLLQKVESYSVPYIHRNVATRGDLEMYLRKWVQKKYADHPILYLAFHGAAGALRLSGPRTSRNLITLDIFEENLRDSCRGRLIYFGSCSTLDVPQERLERFLRATRALAVCGYTDEIDWLKSAAFDLLAIGAMQHNTLTPSGVQAMARRVERDTAGLGSALKFRMAVGGGRIVLGGDPVPLRRLGCRTRRPRSSASPSAGRRSRSSS